MSKTAKLLVTVGRPEFLPANSASLVLGVSWGLNLPVDVVWGLVIPLVLAFATITLVAAFAAHINTLSDYKLDVEDDTKKKLVEAVRQLGTRKIKRFMVVELTLSIVLLLLLVVLQSKPVLLLMWAAAVFLAYAYSAPPLRLKSRSFLAPITLMIVLSILPVTFVTYVFTTSLGLYFWIFLAGQAITVYSVIIPAEIRDYFGDKARGVKTMTVQLGLKNASLLELGLLSLGGVLCGGGFFLALTAGAFPFLSVFLVVMAVVYGLVLSKYVTLFRLSKDLARAEKQKRNEQDVVVLAAQNPRWITLITQSIVIVSIVLLISKFL